MIIDTIERFSTFSGYKTNWNKSELMPAGSIDCSELSHFPFKISNDKCTYLGIVVTKLQSVLLAASYSLLLEKLQTDIQFWRSLPTSLIGRVNAIKVIFPPQLLYLFHNLPVFFSIFFFVFFNSWIQLFYLFYGIIKVTGSKRERGQALLNFHFY